MFSIELFWTHSPSNLFNAASGLISDIELPHKSTHFRLTNSVRGQRVDIKLLPALKRIRFLHTQALSNPAH